MLGYTVPQGLDAVVLDDGRVSSFAWRGLFHADVNCSSSMAHRYADRLGREDAQILYPFAEALFTGWDHAISNETSAQLRKLTLRTTFKVCRLIFVSVLARYPLIPRAVLCGAGVDS